jgi:hypothetical protein
MLLVAFLLIAFHSVFGQGRTTDSIRTPTFIRIPVNGNYMQINAADSQRAGAMSAIDKKKIDRIEVFQSLAELKNTAVKRTDVMYRLLDRKSGTVADLFWDPQSNAKDDSVMVFALPGQQGGRFLRSYSELYVEWFGATADDQTDDSYAFQKAIDFAIKNAQSAKLKCKGGVFNVKNLVVANYNNGNAGYVAFTLEGVAPAYDGVSVSPRMTELRTMDGTAFTLAVQRGLNVSIRNISFRGAGPTPSTLDELIRWTGRDWNQNGAIRDNPQSPHAGIVIDGFYKSVSPADRYPGARAWYSNSVRTGSSCVIIDGCAMRNYNVGIMVTPAPGITNADNISFQNGVQFSNRVFWASGQTQSRSNSIVNLYSFGAVECLVDCRDYGSNTGTPPTVLNSSIAGGTKYLYNTFTNFGSVRFVNTYMESLWSLGKSDGSFPVIFDNCDINLEYGNTWCSPVLAQGGPLHFRGGYLAYFDNQYAQGFTFANLFVSFDGSTILGGVPINFYPPNDNYGPMSIDNVIYSNTETRSVLKKGIVESSSRLFQHDFVLPEASLRSVFDISYKPQDNYFEQVPLENAVILKLDPANHSASFTSANPAQYSVGNYLTTQVAVDYKNDIYDASRTGLGWVSAINGNTITLSYAPAGLKPEEKYSVYASRMLRFIPRIIGNTTAGSNQITGIISGSGLPIVGEYIKGRGIPNNTRVTAVSGNSLTLSQPATTTGTDIEFYDAKTQAIGIHGGKELGYDSPIWFFGDIIKNDDPANPTLDYIRITAPGKMGTNHPAKFTSVRQ